MASGCAPLATDANGGPGPQPSWSPAEQLPLPADHDFCEGVHRVAVAAKTYREASIAAEDAAFRVAGLGAPESEADKWRDVLNEQALIFTKAQAAIMEEKARMWETAPSRELRDAIAVLHDSHVLKVREASGDPHVPLLSPANEDMTRQDVERAQDAYRELVNTQCDFSDAD